MDTALFVDFLSATVRIATPILMAAMGGILIERLLKGRLRICRPVLGHPQVAKLDVSRCVVGCLFQ